MAERGAFLTATTISRPSVFEVLAQDNLAITIHPALKRVANVCLVLLKFKIILILICYPFQFLATANPRIYGWILEWFDEIYLIFNYCVQTHYLRNYSKRTSYSSIEKVATKNSYPFRCLLCRDILRTEKISSRQKRLVPINKAEKFIPGCTGSIRLC
jgi:hypothetical protein